MSIIKILLVFYLIMGSSLTQPLLSKQWVTLVQDNRLIQHLLGLITMIILVTLTVKETVELDKIIFYSLIGYLWFIFSTKMDIQINIIIMIIILMGYFYERSIKSKQILIQNDKILSEEQKQIMLHTNDNTKKYIFVGLIGLTILGMFMYSNKKDVQYGGGYSLVNFLLY